MRRYRIEIRGREFEIEVEELAADRFEVVVGDESYEVTLSSDEDLPEAQITPQFVPVHGAGAARAVAAKPVREAAAPTASPWQPAARQSATAGTASALNAPMPGVIVEVSVQAGARVRRGDVVAILEAMKMNNMIRAPRDGTVAEVLVVEGQSVGHGDAIVRFEAE